MKLAVAIADKNAEPDAFVVWRGFEESIVKAKAFGYDGVELALCTKDEFDVKKMQKILQKNDMEVSCISTGQVFSKLHRYLTNTDLDERMKAVKSIFDLIELAKEFGHMVNIGRVRGFYTEGQNKETVKELFRDSLLRIAEKADRNNVEIVIEPVNRYEINFINNLDECASLLQLLGLKNVGIMPDVFHMNIEEPSIGGSIEKHAEQIRYIHLADSNRHAPGNGHMDFGEVFKSLQVAKYNSWASVEILPVPTPDEAALEAAKYLLPYIKRHNLQFNKGN